MHLGFVRGVVIFNIILCAVQDSNLSPFPRQGNALPNELTAHPSIIHVFAKFSKSAIICACLLRPHRLTVRTTGFQSVNRSSILREVTFNSAHKIYKILGNSL